uniref:Uncharacterized protein n=1 Tax=Anguilla anguilla TaxID=7936 RepID=A0A0E9UPI0_ANGAN
MEDLSYANTTARHMTASCDKTTAPPDPSHSGTIILISIFCC